MIKKISKRLQEIQKAAISASMPDARAAAAAVARTDEAGNKAAFAPLATPLADELAEAGDAAARALREKQRAMIDALDLSK